ncbi:MAG: lipopolysaccharide transport system permease protein [Acidobacteriota bacterium]|jgi:lipopolysaccharide transport system permease protein|nr:lipopolysaccharide transport system permease protein [Acidobacteriota bacterium]
MINEHAGVAVTDPTESPVTSETAGTHTILPGEPVIRIRPESSPLTANLREVWASRELLYFLTWRDLKVRYKQTMLGVAWVILQPLLMAMVFAVFMGRLARIPTDGLPPAVFVYSGLLPWLFFSNSVASGSHSLIGNSYLITKIYLPRLILPIAVVGVRLVDFLIAFSVLVGMMLYYHVPVTWSVLLLPLFMAQITMLALGISVWFSVLNARYRDVGAVLPVLLQLWMFVSPIIYPASLVPQGWRFFYALNPVSGIVEGFRACLFGFEFDWFSIALSAVITLLTFLYFIYDFCRKQDSLVDII